MVLARSLIASVMAALLCAAPAAADTFPSRPITILVPYSPGGPTDTAARVLGEHMAVTLGQNMVVENLTGGGGTIATGRAARATPDGYTLLLHQLALAANVTLLPNQPYDTEKELTGVGLVNFSPMVLVGRKTLPAGSGTLAHLCAALLAQSLGVKVTMIPYRGGTPAITDIMAGHSDIYCSSPLTAMEQIRGKLIKAFAVTSPRRMVTLPEVPSAVAMGYKDLDIQFWQGLYVAAGTPKPVVERLNNALQLALADPKVLQGFADTGMSAFPGDERTPEAATAKLRDEIKRWGEVIRANNIVAAP
jgi:tripartite-type tricarboxylate transporter receptor subunit TctC